MPFTVYLLRTDKNTLYVGQTKDLEKRLRTHHAKSGQGSRYLRAFKNFELVYTETFATRSEAMKREIQIRHLRKNAKEALISSLHPVAFDANTSTDKPRSPKTPSETGSGSI